MFSERGRYGVTEGWGGGFDSLWPRVSLFHCVLMRETWAHAVLARLTYRTQQRSDTARAASLYTPQKCPTVTVTHSWNRCKKTQTYYCVEVQLWLEKVGPHRPHSAAVLLYPVNCSLWPDSMFSVCFILAPGQGAPCLLPCYSCVIHNTPEAGQAIIHSLSLWLVSQYCAPFLLPVCKLKG